MVAIQIQKSGMSIFYFIMYFCQSHDSWPEFDYPHADLPEISLSSLKTVIFIASMQMWFLNKRSLNYMENEYHDIPSEIPSELQLEHC